MRTRFCLECNARARRAEIDEDVLCAKGHSPETSCTDFQDRFEGMRTGIYVGGDVVSGAAMVIKAIETGKIAGKSITAPFNA